MPSLLDPWQSRRMRRTLAALVLVAACSSHSTSAPAPTASPSASPSASPTPTATPTAVPTRPVPHGITKVLTIVEENHGTAETRAGMPYLTSLAATYGVATDYQSLTHPSLPNYLAMLAGSTLGVADDNDPAAHPVSGPSVLDLALSHGHTAKVYAESMPSNCDTSSVDNYAARHNTWTYFPAGRAACSRLDVAADNIDADAAAGSLPNVGLLIPDLCHDAHSCPLGEADGYLHDVMKTVMSGSDWQSGHLAIVITFDEVEGDAGGTLLTTIVAPSLHGVRVAAPLNHYSWSRWMTDLVGAPPLRLAARAPSLGKAFNL